MNKSLLSQTPIESFQTLWAWATSFPTQQAWVFSYYNQIKLWLDTTQFDQINCTSISENNIQMFEFVTFNLMQRKRHIDSHYHDIAFININLQSDVLVEFQLWSSNDKEIS